jgi:hypothetical protein
MERRDGAGLMAATTQRTKILDAVKQALLLWYGPTGTVVANTFRKVERRQWMPGCDARPSAFVNDDGVRKSDGAQSERTKEKTLGFQVVINLAADFGTERQVTDWTDIVEGLCVRLQNYNPKCGVKRLDVTMDTPVKVELMTGDSEHIWVIECEADYFVEVAEFA